jgi:hypothetical protein
MGANASSYGHATDEKLVDLPLPGEDEAILDLPAPPKADEPLLNLPKMKRRACSVDPKLASNPKRKAPPINPKTCKEGSVAMGKDNEFYVIKSGRWMKVSKRLDEKKKEQIREKLNSINSRTQGARKRVAAKRAKAAQTPKRRPAKKSAKKSPAKKSAKKSPAKKASAKKVESPKRGRGRPKGSKNKKSSKTPKRK